MNLQKNKIVALQIGLLFAVSILLRLADLGYSDFQGDEISALCRASDFKTPLQFLAFLLGQRKGPVQYLVTCAISLFDPAFSSELALRLPFAAASLIALVCFFVLVYRLFSVQVAIYSTFLLGTNGIFIAFARIVQYQSFVVLGVLAGILGLTLALQHEKWRVPGLYAGFLAAALGLLAHFDAVFVIPPMAVLLFHWWRNFHNRPDFALLRRHLIAAATLSAIPVLGFYLEYAQRLSSFQTEYWMGRLTGDSTNILHLFRFYNPGPVLWISLGAAIVGLRRVGNSIQWQVVLAWFLPPLIFMTLIFSDSRTHAYTYLLPLLIVAGRGIDTVIDWFHRLLGGRFSQLVRSMILLTFLIFAYFGYSIFVDHNPEYPWESKRFLNIEAEGGNLVGTFGFPYSRQWREIARWFERLPEEELTLVTNEKLEIARFYLPSKVRFRYRLSQYPGHVSTKRVYFLVISRPQSWMDRLWGWSLVEWRQNLVPQHEFFNEEGRLVASVYFLTRSQIENEFLDAAGPSPANHKIRFEHNPVHFSTVFEVLGSLSSRLQVTKR